MSPDEPLFEYPVTHADYAATIRVYGSKAGPWYLKLTIHRNLPVEDGFPEVTVVSRNIYKLRDAWQWLSDLNWDVFPGIFNPSAESDLPDDDMHTLKTNVCNAFADEVNGLDPQGGNAGVGRWLSLEENDAISQDTMRHVKDPNSPRAQRRICD